MSREPFWRRSQPLVLASGSAARRMLLENAGIPLEILKAPVNETAIAATLLESRTNPREIAISLAQAKAEAAARKMPERLLLAADQTLDFDGTLMMKPVDPAHGRAQLEKLRGETHILHSAAVLRLGNQVIWSGVASATLTMRAFSEEFLASYLMQMGDRLCDTVGGYQLEALGIHLFDRIDGDHATILGLPLIPVLHGLRDAGYLDD